MGAALFRLGTHIDMKKLWVKLRSTESFWLSPLQAESWIVTNIVMLLNDVFIRTDEVM
jgi:hypothetical protein